jgi:hypothetical protein
MEKLANVIEVSKSGIVELRKDELMKLEGGIGFWVGVGIGISSGWVVDGVLKATTGKSGSDWVAKGIKCLTSSTGSYTRKNPNPSLASL